MESFCSYYSLAARRKGFTVQNGIFMAGDETICVDAWYANDDVIAPPPTGQSDGAVKFVLLDLYYFCSFNYSPLVNLITNGTLKRIFCSIYKV
jgi:hypothetical protein